MEVEREKKEKLASARKKLNEYKLIRSGGAGGRSSLPSVTSSQPAASFNIFNPAAVNNNVPSPLFVPVTSPIMPVTPSQEISNFTDPNVSYFPNQHQVSTASINQAENVQFNPFTPPPTSAAQQYLESLDLSEKLRADNSNSQQSSTPTPPILLSPINTTTAQVGAHDDSLETFRDQEQDALVFDNNIQKPEADAGADISANSNDILIVTPSNTEFLPSAPVFDPVTGINENSEQPVLTETASAKNESNESLSTENQQHSNMFTETSQPDNILNMAATISQQNEGTQESNNASQSIPVFASSLFGASNSQLDGIFSFGDNLQQPPLIPPKEDAPPAFTDKHVSNPLSEPIHDSSEAGALFISPNNLTTENITTAEADVEVKITPFETQLESNIQSTSPIIEAQFQEEKHFSQANTEVIAALPNVQLSTSFQEALELQIEELRRENTYLLGRQTELTTKIEESEKLAHEFKLEKDRVREEAATTSQALRARINSLCEENQRIVKNSTDVGVDLRANLAETSKQLEEMQKAVIIVSQSKMDFAGRLDHELERVKELEILVKEKEEEIVSLRAENTDLQEKLKQDHQKDAVIHQLQDQARHYQVQYETVQRELQALRNKLKTQQDRKTSTPANSALPNQTTTESSSSDGLTVPDSVTPVDASNLNNVQCESHNHEEPGLDVQNSHEHEHSHTDDHHHDCSTHSHANDEHHHHHDHGEKGHHHHHDHDHHHDHGEKGHHHHHEHTHDHAHDHDHEEGHHHHHSDETVVAARRGPSDELTELKKTLHRLEWENSSFRNEIDVLAVDAKQKRTYEEKCSSLQEENQRLRKEVEQLEHVIIQLQGENDTIGDYITLYQTQKMALKECAKEKDAHLELLSREREMLLQRLAELTALVKDLRESKSEAGSQCADDHMHTLDTSFPSPHPQNKRQIEGKIRDLLTEISSSSLIENFHPCAVCSGRLMTV